ncbi:MAG: response regulator transcription factor [Arcobacteraceae bacterium]
MIPSDFSILYVEDNLILKDQYIKFLKLYFKNVYEATDGEDALQKYSLYNPNIAILDINIPKINGLEVAKRIREKDDTIILIMLTAYSDTEKLLDAIELNLCKYLIKPVKTFDLEKIIKIQIKILNNKRTNRNVITLEKGFQWNKLELQLYTVDNQKIKLTKKEHLLLELFCKNKHTIFSNEDIINYIWENEDDNYNPNKLRIIFSKLKKKLDCNLFDSMYNVGYKLKGNF